MARLQLPGQLQRARGQRPLQRLQLALQAQRPQPLQSTRPQPRPKPERQEQRPLQQRLQLQRPQPLWPLQQACMKQPQPKLQLMQMQMKGSQPLIRGGAVGLEIAISSRRADEIGDDVSGSPSPNILQTPARPGCLPSGIDVTRAARATYMAAARVCIYACMPACISIYA